MDFLKIVQNSRNPSVFEGTKIPPFRFHGTGDGQTDANVGQMVGSKHAWEGLWQAAGCDEIQNAAHWTRFHGSECEGVSGSSKGDPGRLGENSGEPVKRLGTRTGRLPGRWGNSEPFPWHPQRETAETRRLGLAIGATGRPIGESDARVIRAEKASLRAHTPVQIRFSQRFLCFWLHSPMAGA